jgi:hypothetical protein
MTVERSLRASYSSRRVALSWGGLEIKLLIPARTEETSSDAIIVGIFQIAQRNRNT